MSLPMMTLVINTRCNQECAYCPPMGESHMCSPGHLNFLDAQILARMALEQGVNRFRISGGEPLLHREINSFALLGKELKSKGASVYLNTNGVLLHKFEKVITPESFTSLRISLDSLEQEKYRKITGTNTLLRVLQNIKHAKEQGHSIDLIMVVMQYNFNEIEAMINFCVENDIGLKLSDLERHQYDTQELWKNQYVSLEHIRSFLEKKAIKVKPVVGDFGMEMIGYYIDGVQIRVKDSFRSAVYTDFCKANCDMFPCAEGVYSILVKADGSISWCKRNESVVVANRKIRDEADFLKYFKPLKTSIRLNHLESQSESFKHSSLKNNEQLLPIFWVDADVSHGYYDQNKKHDFRFTGGQKKFGRDL